MLKQELPRVLLFDIGGVCVVSPFKAILDYERKHSIPSGYINYSISKTSPNGTWHKLERGEIKLDADYFRNFKADLENEARWREYHQELSAKASSLSNTPAPAVVVLPPLPSIDAETLFWAMMTEAQNIDPHMGPALHKLAESKKFKLAALSNTIIFPPDHPFSKSGGGGAGDIRQKFEVFVSSAHVGMRKPDRRIYEYTLENLRSQFGKDLQPNQIVFLDDIGENLKTARSLGWRTIKVRLGKTDEAVRELEKITGLALLSMISELEVEKKELQKTKKATARL